ncbi:hypothetical protein EON80_03985 [bacterium]|nr:MAG: hypothetical protein EON80_03985 [bacterium]
MNAKNRFSTGIAKAVGLSFACFFALQIFQVIGYICLQRSMNTDVYLQGTNPLILNIPYVVVSATLSVYCGGLSFLWPKMTDRPVPKTFGLVLFTGFALTFFPQFVLGLWNAHNRYHAYRPEFGLLNVTSRVGIMVLLLGFLLPIFWLLWSLKYGSHESTG